MSAAIAIGATLFLGAFYSWTSRTNGLFFFGRSAGMDLRDSAEAKTITRQYLTAVLLTTVAGVLLAWAASRLGRNFAAIGPFLEAVAFWALFARANRQVRALEISRGTIAARESVFQVPLLETPGYRIPSLPLALLPATLSALAFVGALLVAQHGTDLRAGWSLWIASVDSQHLGVLFGMGLGLLTSATACLLVFRSSVRLRTRMAQYTVRTSVLLEWIGLAVLLAVLACNYLGVNVTHQANRALTITGVVAALGTVLWNQIRAKRFVPPPVELGADDRWRWGLFYVDRNDPALFVQSRCGAGYTLNYGRMLAWPIALALVAYLVAMLFMPIHH